jgi:hypothetical protein
VDVDAHLHGLLGSAYRRALAVAQAHACESVGLCLLSAGVFRGAQPLEAVVEVKRRAASFSVFPAFFPVLFVCMHLGMCCLRVCMLPLIPICCASWQSRLACFCWLDRASKYLRRRVPGTSRSVAHWVRADLVNLLCLSVFILSFSLPPPPFFFAS